MTTRLVLTLLTLFAASLPLFAASPVNYAGNWTFDPAASKGMPPMFSDVTAWTLGVTQDAKQLHVKVHVANKRPDMPPMDQSFDYALDGTETKTKSTIMSPAGAQEVPTTLKGHVGENGAIDVSIVREIEMGEQSMSLTIAEGWELGADGKTLTVHRHDDGPMGKRDWDVVFRKSE
jgi:hypothetical protein